MPKVSVIIPVYNVEQYLCECLDSVINQTLKDIEIICVNDGSTDNSLQILKQYAQQDKRFIIINQNNCGLSCSRNNALKIATGKLIVFLDSDDYITLDSIEKIFNQMILYDLDMLSFSGVNFKSETRQIENNPYWDFLYLPHGFDTTCFDIKQCWNFLHLMSVSSCLTAYKKSFITNNKLKFPNGLYFEDNLFFTKAITKATRLGIIQDKLYFRRIHNDSITQNLNYHFQDLIKINDLTLEYLHTSNIKDKIRRQSINFRCNLILTRFEQLNKQEQQNVRKDVIKLMKKYKFYKTPATRYRIKPYILFPYYLLANLWMKVVLIPLFKRRKKHK